MTMGINTYICWKGGETDAGWCKASTAEGAAHKFAHGRRGHMTEATRYFAVNCKDAADSFGGTFEMSITLVVGSGVVGEP